MQSMTRQLHTTTHSFVIGWVWALVGAWRCGGDAVEMRRGVWQALDRATAGSTHRVEALLLDEAAVPLGRMHIEATGRAHVLRLA